MPTLDFKGKQFIYAHHLGVPYRTLEMDAKKSVSGGKAADGNMIIQGDNLDALKALLPTHAGRVNCVCIDPPYNTGSEHWCYNDNVNSPMMKRWLADNSEVDSEDDERHEKWLCMMWPRLQLLHELLAENGFIFVFIDDNEQHRLRVIMDEIFGEDFFVGVVAWKKTSGDSTSEFSFTHDNIVIYKKGEKLPRQPLTPDQRKQYSNPDNDPRGDWAAGDYRCRRTRDERPNLYYAITNPNTGEKIYPDTHSSSTRVWGTSQQVHEENEKAGLIWWGPDGTAKEPKKKRFLSGHRGINMRSVWLDAGTNDEGGRMLDEIFPDARKNFSNPKPVSVVQRIVKVASGHDGIVLDSFAGSGTTAHAVLALNEEDGGNRKFILVECEDYANTITAERVRRVIKGVKTAKDKALKKGLGGGFSFCTLGADLELEEMLADKGKLPSYDAMARYLAHTAVGASLDKLKKGKDGFFGEVGDCRLHLIYKPDRAFLESPDSALSAPLAEKIQKAAAGKKALVFAPWKFMSQAELTPMGIVFCQLPYAVHRLLGDSADVS